MTCIPNGTLLEVVRAHGTIELCEVEKVRVGDELCSEGTTASVQGILCQETGGMWPIYTYIGLNADPTQWVQLPHGQWERISNVGTFSLSPCHTLYGIVVSGGKTIRAGGVRCCAHNWMNVHS